MFGIIATIIAAKKGHKTFAWIVGIWSVIEIILVLTKSSYAFGPGWVFIIIAACMKNLNNEGAAREPEESKTNHSIINHTNNSPPRTVILQDAVPTSDEDFVVPLPCTAAGYMECPRCHSRQLIGRERCLGCNVRLKTIPISPASEGEEEKEENKPISASETVSVQTEQVVPAPETKPYDNSKTLPSQSESPKVRFCRKCGYELIEGSDFCSHCGKRVLFVPQTAEPVHTIKKHLLTDEMTSPSNISDSKTAVAADNNNSEIKEISDIFDLGSCIGACVHIVSDNLCFVPDSPNGKPCLKYLYGRGDILIGLNLISYDGLPHSRFGEVREIYGTVKKAANNEYSFFLDNAFFTPSKSNLSQLHSLPFSDHYAYSEISSNTIRLFDTNCRSITSLSIPEKIGNKTVCEVAGFCGYDNLESVSIPDSVNVLADGAFSYCPLLRKVSLGKNIHEIGHDTFFSSDMIEEYVVSPDNPKLRSVDGLLLSANLKVLFRVPPHRTGRLFVPEGVAIITSNAFRSSLLNEVILPNTVKTIKENAFYCAKNIKQITIPASVKKIEDRALITDGSFSFNDNTDNHAIVITTKGSYAERYARENSHPIRYM